MIVYYRLIFPKKHLEIKKKSGNLATLSYLTELPRIWGS